MVSAYQSVTPHPLLTHVPVRTDSLVPNVKVHGSALPSATNPNAKVPLTATRLYDINRGKFFPDTDGTWWDECRRLAPAALLQRYPRLATWPQSLVTGSFGPAWLATWEGARQMDRTGLLEFEVRGCSVYMTLYNFLQYLYTRTKYGVCLLPGPRPRIILFLFYTKYQRW